MPDGAAPPEVGLGTPLLLHKDGRTSQTQGPHSELCLPETREGASGVYWYQATAEGSRSRNRAPSWR